MLKNLFISSSTLFKGTGLTVFLNQKFNDKHNIRFTITYRKLGKI